MATPFRQFYDVARDDGIEKALRLGLESTLRRLYVRVADNPQRMYVDTVETVANSRNINICYNQCAREQYDESMTNVLIVTEGPALVEGDDWLDPSFDFHAEFSYGDYYGLDHFFSLRRMMAGRDYRVALDTTNEYADKSRLASIVFADKDEFPGQAMRHDVASRHGNTVDTYGSGVGEYLYDKAKALNDYMFHVAIESGRYPEYVSEKFFDCLKTNTIPIYWGGREAIEKMGFDTDGILFFEDVDDLANILDRISAEEYERLRPHAEYNRERLVEIRNDLKRGFYFDHIRLNSLSTSDDLKFETTRPHLRFE